MPVDAHWAIFSLWITSCGFSNFRGQFSSFEYSLDVSFSEVFSLRKNNISSHYLLSSSHTRKSRECLKVLWVPDLRASRALTDSFVCLSKWAVSRTLKKILDRVLSPLQSYLHYLIHIVFLSLWSLLFNLSFCWLSDHFALNWCFFQAWSSSRSLRHWGCSSRLKLFVLRLFHKRSFDFLWGKSLWRFLSGVFDVDVNFFGCIGEDERWDRFPWRSCFDHGIFSV